MGKNNTLYLFFQLTLCLVVILEILFLHQPIRIKKPPRNNKRLTIIDHMKISELFRNVFVNDSLNKIIEARINMTPIEIGCFLEK